MTIQKKLIKVYVVGTSIGYASWLNRTLVQTMEEADLVLFTGGEDIDPTFYKQKKGSLTSCNYIRDLHEVAEAEKAIKLGKNIFGTCRGAQLGCVMAGGLLVQHMSHPYMHNITMYDGTVIQTNSIHHQLQHPHNLHPLEYVVAGWAKGLSNIYLNGEDREIILPSVAQGNASYSKEAELVYYRKNKWLGIQGHPECLANDSTMNNMLRAMVDLMIEDKLDIVLSLNIPIDRYVGKPLVLLSDEIQMYENMIVKRKEYERDLLLN